MAATELSIRLTLQNLASRGLEEFRQGFRRGLAGVAQDADRTTAALRSGMQSISTQLATLQRLVVAYQSVVGALHAGAGIVRAADEFRQLSARLALATGSAEAAGRALDDVRRIANANGQELASVGTLYARLATAMRDMGVGQAEAARATEAVSLALRVSGAGTAEAASATLQLSQAFASGTLRGDEFNSVNEAAPRIMQAVAEHLGVTRGKLREMAEAGQLTADVLRGALMGSMEKLRAESARLPDTMEQAANRVRNAWTDLVARFDQSTGASQAVAGALNGLAANMDEVIDLGKLLGEGVLVVLAGRMISAWRAALAGQTALGALGAAAGGALRMLGGWPTLLLAIGAGLFKAGYELARFVDTAVNGDRELAASREASFAATGALIDKYSQYANALVLTGQQVRGLATTELLAYRERLAGAIAYYNALYEAEAKRGDAGDEKAKAQARAQVDVYVQAMAALKPVLKDRETLEKDHAARLVALQDEARPQMKAALEAQTKLYEEANRKVEDLQRQREEALKRQARFQSDLLAGPAKPAAEMGIMDVDAEKAAAREAAAAGDTDTALAKVERLREALTAMRASGAESTLVLSGLAREIARIETQALDQAAAQAQAEQDSAKNKLIELQNLDKSMETIPVAVDQEAAMAAMQDTMTHLQQLADANPVIQKVILQAQDQMLLDANAQPQAQKKAAGGLVTGPGTDTSDNLLAWLSPGEFVIRAAAVRRWGVGLLSAMNGMRLPARAVAGLPAFAAGGLVGGGQAVVHRVEIVLPSGRTGTVGVASEADAARLNGILGQLGREMARSA